MPKKFDEIGHWCSLRPVRWTKAGS